MAETEFSVTRFKGNPAQAESVYQGMKPLSSEDVAEIVFFVATLAEHINVNTLEVMPIAQAWNGFRVHRQP